MPFFRWNVRLETCPLRNFRIVFSFLIGLLKTGQVRNNYYYFILIPMLRAIGSLLLFENIFWSLKSRKRKDIVLLSHLSIYYSGLIQVMTARERLRKQRKTEGRSGKICEVFGETESICGGEEKEERWDLMLNKYTNCVIQV